MMQTTTETATAETTIRPVADWTTEELTAAFNAAREAGEKANENKEDGGACNFDTATLRLGDRHQKAKDEAKVMQAAREAGLHLSLRKWYGANRAFLSLNAVTGQGNRNTRVAEAICKSLEGAGLPMLMYYQLD